jgi:membrane fusion protein
VTSSVFRTAALRARGGSPLGDMLLTRPIAFAWWTAACGGIACAIGAFLVWGTYTEHSTLSGRLTPDLGIIEVRAPAYGAIVNKRVIEGAHVRRNDVLYVVSGERVSAAVGLMQTSIAQALAERRRRVEEQIADVRTLAAADSDGMQQGLSALKKQARQVAQRIDTQTSRVALAERGVARYARMESDGFASKEQRILREQDWLEQRARLQAFEQERAELEQRIADTVHRLTVLPVQTRDRIAELERTLARIRQESIRNEADRRVRVVAPADGIATGVLGEAGQAVDPNRVLVSIVPDGATLQAQLDAPSRAVGFIDVGDTVLLRYPAYPYQKFGHRLGRVVAISRAVLPRAGALAEPSFRVTVALEEQSLVIEGRPRRLKPGMAVEADVLEDTRRLYEWILEPLYAAST